jgi:tRNA dimethylallyltransferase
VTLVVLSGPTASKKSYLADLFFDKYKSRIINSDSMQIYNEMPILTAQPEDRNIEGKYALYTSLDYREKCTVAKYAKLAVAEIENALQENKIPILVGGTGLYIKSILDGLIIIPEISQKIKRKVFEDFENLGKEGFYAQLLKKDPAVADKIRPSDTTRMIRAMEVFMQTGKSISEFKDNIKKLYTGDYLHISLFPERVTLYEWCEKRFDAMIKSGVVDEVKDFIARREPSEGKYGVEASLGYQDIKNYLSGEIDMDEVKDKTKQATRNYAKRQLTWSRNQMPNKKCLHYSDIKEAEDEFFNLLSDFIPKDS